jgi:hypothetical protein
MRNLSLQERKTLLENWSNLNIHIDDFDEAQLAQLLEDEISGRCRKTFVMRIFHRANKIRYDTELAKLQTSIVRRHAELKVGRPYAAEVRND